LIYKKTRVSGLPVGENDMILRSLVLMHYQSVPDRQMDRQTACSKCALCDKKTKHTETESPK